jgi:hypothetical protein
MMEHDDYPIKHLKLFPKFEQVPPPSQVTQRDPSLAPLHGWQPRQSNLGWLPMDLWVKQCHKRRIPQSPFL